MQLTYFSEIGVIQLPVLKHFLPGDLVVLLQPLLPQLLLVRSQLVHGSVLANVPVSIT